MEKQITRRDFLKGIAVSTTGLAIGGCTNSAKSNRFSKTNLPRPNLIYVFADQLRYQSVGYAGDEKAITPAIDRFASQGANFYNAISTMPVCAAHRASLFTGKYPTTTGMVINEIRINPNHECFGHVLTKAGYQTGYIGKWHLWANVLEHHYESKNSFVPPGPHRLGFDGYWAAYNYNHRYYGSFYHIDSPEKIYHGEGVYEPDSQTDLTINFINKAAGTDKPFALFLSYGPPHDPWREGNYPKKYYDMFEGVKFGNPPNYNSEPDKRADNWGRLRPRHIEKLEYWRRLYYALTTSLDDNFERLLKAVEKAGITNNTIIVFTSDHGEMFGAHGRRAKNIFYEEAVRVPFLVRWPGHIPSGTISDVCLGTVDIMPTILSLMDLPVPKEVEGMNLSHCALVKSGPEPPAAFMQNLGACSDWYDGYEWRGLRDKQFTYARYRDGAEFLFDNRKEPYQMTNLVQNPKYKDTLQHCRTLVTGRMDELNDSFETCTWYRDLWTDGNRIVMRGAKG
jgi:arylsulfatase A-like enzyme